MNDAVAKLVRALKEGSVARAAEARHYLKGEILNEREVGTLNHLLNKEGDLSIYEREALDFFLFVGNEKSLQTFFHVSNDEMAGRFFDHYEPAEIAGILKRLPSDTKNEAVILLSGMNKDTEAVLSYL